MHVDWCYCSGCWDQTGPDTSNEVEQCEESDRGAAAGMGSFSEVPLTFWAFRNLLVATWEFLAAIWSVDRLINAQPQREAATTANDVGFVTIWLILDQVEQMKTVWSDSTSYCSISEDPYTKNSFHLMGAWSIFKERPHNSSFTLHFLLWFWLFLTHRYPETLLESLRNCGSAL